MDDSSQSDEEIDQKPDISELEEHIGEESAGDEILDKDGTRPVRPVERQKMRPWLVELLDSNNVPGLSWQNRKDRIFRISWKHAAHNCFNRSRDSDLFERWAYHTGRHYEGNHKRWKANFRCALNSLPDVIELRDLGVRKGDNAFKVYKFLEGTSSTFKDKMDQKKKQSTTSSQLKRGDATSSGEGSSIPTSPEHDGGGDEAEGGMSTLLRAIELHTQRGDSPGKKDKSGKRGADKHKESDGQSSPKRAKKSDSDAKNSNIPTVIHEPDIPVVKGSTSATPNKVPPATMAESSAKALETGVSSPGPVPQVPLSQASVGDPSQVSGTGAGGQQVISVLPLKFPYLGTLEQKTGKITIVHLRKADKYGILNPQDQKNPPEGPLVQLNADMCNFLSPDGKLMAIPVTMATTEGTPSTPTAGAILNTSQGQIFLSQDDLSALKSAPVQQIPLTSQGQLVQGQTEQKSEPVKTVTTASSEQTVSAVPLTSISFPLQGVDRKIPSQGMEGKIGIPMTLPMATIIHNPSATKQGQELKISEPTSAVPSVAQTSKTAEPVMTSATVEGQGQSKVEGQVQSKVQNIPAPVADMLAWMKSHADQSSETGIKTVNHVPVSVSIGGTTCPVTMTTTSTVTCPVTMASSTSTTSSVILPGIQSNKNIVNRFSSIAEALSMASGSSIMPIRTIRTQDVVNATTKPPLSSVHNVVSNPPSITSSHQPILTDTQNVRSKLVTRLLVSGASSSPTPTGPIIQPPAPSPPGVIASPLILNPGMPSTFMDANVVRALGQQVRPPAAGLTAVPVNFGGIMVTAMSANLLGSPLNATSSVALAGSAVLTEEKSGSSKTQQSQELSPPPPALIRMDQVVSETGSGIQTSSGTGDTDSADSEMPKLEQQKDTPSIKPDILKEQVTIELGNIAEETSGVSTSNEAEMAQQYYYCLWCQKHFPRQVDLLHHFMRLHQDMLVVPGDGDKGVAGSSCEYRVDASTSLNVHALPGSDKSGSQGVVIDLPNSAGSQISSVSNQRLGGDKLISTDINIPVSLLAQENVLDLTTKNTGKQMDVLDLRKKGTSKGKTKTSSVARKKEGGKKRKKSLPASENLISETETGTLENQNLIGQPSIVTSEIQNLIGQPGASMIESLNIAAAKGSGVGSDKLSSSQFKIFDGDPATLSQPKYCLNSLIAALRDSIERDKKDTNDKVNFEYNESDETDDGSESATSYGDDSDENHSSTKNKDGSFDRSEQFKDLSPDSESESDESSASALGVDKEIQVSLKTVFVDGKTMYRCSKCNKMFSKTCTFARHAMVHAKLYPYQCGICDELKCSDMRVLLRHLDWHGENVECPCKKCERLYKEDQKTEADQSKGESVACRFSCEICGKKFVSDVVCKAHVNMHRRNSIECEICKMEFKCHRNLSKHRKSSHGIQFCPICFESCRDISSHIHIHPGVFMYKCGLCGDAFNSRPLLHDHLKVHTHLGKNLGTNKSPQKDPQKWKATISSDLKARKVQKNASKKARTSKDKNGTEMIDESHIEDSLNCSLKEDDSSSKTDLARDVCHSPNVKVKVETESLISEDSVGGVSESSVSNVSVSGDGGFQTGSMSLRRKVSRRCRWHDNDSVCERCDETFIKTIAFGRKPKSKTGKDSPRIDDNESRSSIKTSHEFSESGDSLDTPSSSLHGEVEVKMEEK